MDEAMAWAVFTREFNWRRPNSIFSFNVQPLPEPQSRPRDVVEAAIAAGAAEPVESPTAENTPKRSKSP